MTRQVEQELITGPASLTHVSRVDVIRDFTLRVEFDDGLIRDVDLEADLHGPVFGPLRDASLFRQVRVDPDIGTVVWPNGADLAPEFLHDHDATDRAKASSSGR